MGDVRSCSKIRTAVPQVHPLNGFSKKIYDRLPVILQIEKALVGKMLEKI